MLVQCTCTYNVPIILRQAWYFILEGARRFFLGKGHLYWGICKFLLGLLKGHQGKDQGPTEAIASIASIKYQACWDIILSFLTTSRWLMCIHAKLFPTVKRRTCTRIHVLQHYSRNSYFGRHAISRSPAGHLWETPDKRHCKQRSIEPTLFVDFCLIPLSNTCFFVRPARNVNREIYLHRQEGFCVGKFGHMVDQAMLDNRLLHKHFRWSRLRYKRQALLKI